MCQERKRTRDRLLEYDLPLHPRAGGLAMVYPAGKLYLAAIHLTFLFLEPKRTCTFLKVVARFIVLE